MSLDGLDHRRRAVLVALLLVLTGCSLFGNDNADPSLAPVPIGGTNTNAGIPRALKPFYNQKLAWRECRKTDRCAQLTVPLDYAKPRGASIRLSVVKVPSTHKKQRIGYLVVNPGGPGGSGIDYATGGSSYRGEELRSAFDIVGFDPRGVGESTPLRCVTDGQLDTLIASDPDPDSSGEVQADHARWKSFFSGCMQRNAALATHMSTAEAAKDMDILRSALGEGRLTYFGASYGTFLGGTYADLFPQRVGRMVLDGAIDASASSVEMNLVQAEGFQKALQAYVERCIGKGGCYLGDTVDAAIGRIDEFLADLDAKPIAGSEGRVLTEGLGLYGLITPLYNRTYWRILDSALAAGLRGAGAQLLALADRYASRGPYGYTKNALQVLPVVNCLDYDDTLTDAQVAALVPRFERASPTFGRIFTADLGVCGDWSYQSGRHGARLTAKGSAPIVVVGTTRDPATPLRWAEGLVKQLDNAVLVKRDGDGHTGYHAGNKCVDSVVEKYLVSGVVPKDPTSC
jgi:pimeloyl-ACP methyl ester carboxylesterase